MTYIVKVEKNYDAFMNCMRAAKPPKWNYVKTPHEYYQELARFIEKKYNFKCYLHKSNFTRDKIVAFDELEFPSEQDYMLWLLKFSN